MQNSITVFYFDGKSAKKHNAELTFEKDFWNIQLLDEEENSSIQWDIPNIHHSEMVANITIFKYGNFPYQSIETSEPNLVRIIDKHYPNNSFFKSEYKWMHNKGLGTLLAFLLVIASLALATYKFVLPAIAEKVAEHFPQKYEIEMGETMYKNIVSGEDLGQGTMIEVKEKSVLLNEFITHIDFQTQYPIKISVIKDETVNAFALPGGRVVVFTGLLNKFKTKDQLAALLGHEIAHVSNKHSLKNIFRSLSGYIFLSLITTDFNAIATVIIENANQINNLGYSRELEAEADAVSMKVLKNNQLDSKGLLQLFEILEKSADSKTEIELLSTHPLTKDRIAFAKKNILKTDIYSENKTLEQIWQKIKSK